MYEHSNSLFGIEPNWCTNFLNMFIAFLYMFRATTWSSSGENPVPMRHLVFVTVYRWLSGMQAGINSALHTRQSSIYSDKYQESHRYGIFSWWWARSCPKHVQKSNKYIKKICALSWLYHVFTKDYTGMHSQISIKKQGQCCVWTLHDYAWRHTIFNSLRYSVQWTA